MSENTEQMAPTPTLQTYVLSTYPGEHAMVVAHPSNYDAQWYRREDVEKLTKSVEAQLQIAREALRKARPHVQFLIARNPQHVEPREAFSAIDAALAQIT